jgi:hypothetical protein
MRLLRASASHGQVFPQNPADLWLKLRVARPPTNLFSRAVVSRSRAGLLGISAGTVKSTASRALALLRQQPAISGLLAAANDDTEGIRYA